MIKPFFKTLPLSVLAFALAATSPADELSRLNAASAPKDPDQVACSTREAIDRGWEYQRGLLEGRLEAKAPASLEVKGAIISPPFPSYAPYRKDVPSAVPWTQSTDSRLSRRQPAHHEPSVDRF